MNIIWIITDSICNYERNDLHSLLTTFKKLRDNQEGFYFEDAISLFPSTNLSLFSLLTGRFPYYILLDFYYSIDSFPSLIYKNNIEYLKKEKYKIKSILFGREQARLTKKILNPYYNEKLFQGDHWLNAKEVYHLYNKHINEISNGDKNLLFLFFRPGDPKTDIYLSKIIEDLKERDFWEKSIIILNSDHGYYDRRLYKKSKLLHFDDIHQSSIQSVLFLKIPKFITNSKPKTINKRVYLIDILETILDYLGIQPNHEREAISFKELIENDIDVNKDRKIRVDCYLMFQSIKKTAILKDIWKFYYNNGKISLFNLDRDPLERKNVRDRNPKIFNDLYQFFLKTELNAFKIFKSHLDALYDQSILSKIESENIFIPKQFPPQLRIFIKDKLKNKNSIIDLTEKLKINSSVNKSLVTILFFNRLTGYGIKKLRRKYLNYTKRFLILNTQLFDVSDQINKTGYFKFVIRSIINRRKQLFQRWNEIMIWVLYFPLYFIKHIRKFYN